MQSQHDTVTIIIDCLHCLLLRTIAVTHMLACMPTSSLTGRFLPWTARLFFMFPEWIVAVRLAMPGWSAESADFWCNHLYLQVAGSAFMHQFPPIVGMIMWTKQAMHVPPLQRCKLRCRIKINLPNNALYKHCFLLWLHGSDGLHKQMATSTSSCHMRTECKHMCACIYSTCMPWAEVDK